MINLTRIHFSLVSFLGSVITAFLVLKIPTLFSSETFAQLYMPVGGIIHEAVGALFISVIFAVVVLFKDNLFNKLLQISVIASVFISIYIAGRIMMDGKQIMWDRSWWALLSILYESVYYILIFSLPQITVLLLKKITHVSSASSK